MQLNADVFDDARLTDGAKLLYSLMTSLTSKKGYCYASNAYLGNRMQKDKRSIQRLLAMLSDCGHVTIDFSDDSDDRKIWCNTGTGRVGAPHDKNVTPRDKSDVGATTEMSPLNNVDIEKNNKTPIVPKAIYAGMVEYSSHNEELFEALMGFAESRSKNKSPISTERAWTLLRNKLDMLSGGSDARKIELLDEATLNGWKSVYDRSYKNTQPTRVVESEEVRAWG